MARRSSNATLPLTLCAVLALVHAAWGGGVITNFSQAELESALAGGGAVVFGTNGTVVLSRTITVTKDASLVANGYNVTISGAGAVRLFQVNTNVQLELRGVSLADGLAAGTDGQDGDPPLPGQDGYGAGILNLGGTLRLLSCTVSNCIAQGGNAGRQTNLLADSGGSGGRGFGAGLCNLGGQLYLTNCTLSGNRANGGQGGIRAGTSGNAMGGAIWSDGGVAHLRNVTVINNQATGGAATSSRGYNGRAGDGLGGALFATNSSLYMESSLLISNTASGGLAPDSITFGGNSHGGAALGGAVFVSAGSSGSIAASSFQGNSANGGNAGRYSPSGNSRGGSIFNAGTLELSETTFTGGSSVAGSGSLPAAVGQGGAICSENSLVINACTFNGNRVQGGSACGCASGGPGGAAEGGSLWSSGLIAATNCTLVSNSAVGGDSRLNLSGPPYPGGSARGGAVYMSGGTATLINQTVAANQVKGGSSFWSPELVGTAEGGSLWSTNSTVTLRNTIVANSIGGGEVSGAVTDGGYNLCSDGTAGFSAGSSHNNTDPLLGPLADNDGPTKTIALLPGSPARDAIPSDFPVFDQRGTSRPQGLRADIGAFEAIATGPGPIIVTQPQGGTVRWGTNVTLTVRATASGPVAYQWLKDGAPIAGATNSLLALTHVQASDAGVYSVQLTSAGLQVSSQSAVLTVDSTPLIVSSPRDVVVSVGGSASFTVVAEGPALSYQWGHNGLAVPGASTPTLVIPSAQAGAQGTYRVEVSNSAGSTSSLEYHLSFDASGLGILAPPPGSVTVLAGDLVTLSTLAGGIAPIAYQWQSQGADVSGATNSSFTFNAPAQPGTYFYAVRLANAYGAFTNTVALDVHFEYYWGTLAGGATGSADGAGREARFNSPQGVGVDASGNVYVVDTYNYTIRKITPAGVVTTLAGSAGISGTADGTNGAARFSNPTGVAIDRSGNLFVTDSSIIRKITPAGVVTKLRAQFVFLTGLAMDGQGILYVVDQSNNTIDSLDSLTDPAGATILAGSPGSQGSADGTNTAARFYRPQGIAVDRDGNLYVTDTSNRDIRKITAAGVVSTLAGSARVADPGSADGTGSAASFFQPMGAAVDGEGNVYVADAVNSTVRKISPAGVVTTIGGFPLSWGIVDGWGSAARFDFQLGNAFAGLVVDGAGNLYLADNLNARIVKGVPPRSSPVQAVVAGNYWMNTLPNQPGSLSVATLLQVCTAPVGDALTITSVGPTRSPNGIVQLSGSNITYSPPEGFVGLDSFTYTIMDSRGASTQGTVLVPVTPSAGGVASTVGIKAVGSNSTTIRFIGLPGIAHHVEVSTDLVHWTELGVAIAGAGSDNVIEFIDTATSGATARFYRTRVP